MARWADVETEAPELARLARGFLDARVHKTLATVRKDGSPRISGTESAFEEGDLVFGSMWRATKALDLLRDPRFALHSGTEDPPAWKGDAKVAGRAIEITDPERKAAHRGGESPPGPWHLFRAEIEEVVVVRLNEEVTKLIIESWRTGRGLRREER